MSDQNHTPYAFPSGDNECHGGMFLRDYFATKAMASLIVTPVDFSADAETSSAMTTWDDIAKGAYQMADAMLEARSK